MEIFIGVTVALAIEVWLFYELNKITGFVNIWKEAFKNEKR